MGPDDDTKKSTKQLVKLIFFPFFSPPCVSFTLHLVVIWHYCLLTFDVGENTARLHKPCCIGPSV